MPLIGPARVRAPQSMAPVPQAQASAKPYEYIVVYNA